MNPKEPLAFRMRPKTLDEYVGQEHVLGKDKILYRTIKADRLSSIILFGPPGCGKTSLARVISETTKYNIGARVKNLTRGSLWLNKYKAARIRIKSIKIFPDWNIVLAIFKEGINPKIISESPITIAIIPSLIKYFLMFEVW